MRVKPSVYIETSVISYLVGWLNRNVCDSVQHRIGGDMDFDFAVGGVRHPPKGTGRGVQVFGARAVRLAVMVLMLASCAPVAPLTAPAEVKVVDSRESVRDCSPLGFVNTQTMALHPREAFVSQVRQMGGDTLLMPVPFLKIEEPGPGPTTPVAYLCDRERMAALRDRAALVDAVRVTNRQDVVSKCRFVKNAVAASEREARLQTVELGGDVFFVISDTARTETTKAADSRTAYTYEVRRLTGEVYRCAAVAP
jgi:hypothetical protein